MELYEENRLQLPSYGRRLYEQVRFCGLDEDNQLKLDRLIKSLIVTVPKELKDAMDHIRFYCPNSLKVVEAYIDRLQHGDQLAMELDENFCDPGGHFDMEAAMEKADDDRDDS